MQHAESESKSRMSREHAGQTCEANISHQRIFTSPQIILTIGYLNCLHCLLNWLTSYRHWLDIGDLIDDASTTIRATIFHEVVTFTRRYRRFSPRKICGRIFITSRKRRKCSARRCLRARVALTREPRDQSLSVSNRWTRAL